MKQVRGRSKWVAIIARMLYKVVGRVFKGWWWKKVRYCSTTVGRVEWHHSTQNLLTHHRAIWNHARSATSTASTTSAQSAISVRLSRLSMTNDFVLVLETPNQTSKPYRERLVADGSSRGVPFMRCSRLLYARHRTQQTPEQRVELGPTVNTMTSLRNPSLVIRVAMSRAAPVSPALWNASDTLCTFLLMMFLEDLYCFIFSMFNYIAMSC